LPNTGKEQEFITLLCSIQRLIFMKYIVVVAAFLFTFSAQAQKPFGDRCVGVWTGMMYIQSAGILRDSVEVKLTVAAKEANAWTWKMEYLSAKMPMTKDYVLRLKDAAKNFYVTDEGGGLELNDYLFGDKLYCVFETGGYLLTSTYELRGNELIFEVTSGKKLDATHPQVSNFSVGTLQRVILKRK
jgi:hypothetical protein